MHITNGLTIKCPFTVCACQYSVIFSFSAHISQKHSCTDWPIFNLEVVNQDIIDLKTAVGENVQAALGTGTSLLDCDELGIITFVVVIWSGTQIKAGAEGLSFYHSGMLYCLD